MSRVCPHRASLAAVLLASALLPAVVRAADAPPAGETPAEKLRKALDRVRELQISDQPLDVAVNQLREQTGINFTIDQAAVPPAVGALVGQLGVTGSYAHLKVSAPGQHIPVRSALTKMLRGHNLAHVIVGDTVLITSHDKAVERQLGQPVSVNAEATPMRSVLERLGRETGANLVLDPRAAKEGQTALTLHLDEVPLETAVDLLADEVGLKAVRLSNVLYVTTEARAEKLAKAQPAAPPAVSWQVWPDGNGNFRLTPPAGLAPAAGVMGAGGIAGLGGMAGVGGLGQLGALGAVGVGGGGMVGIGGGVASPVPLTPPLPGKKDTPAKPKEEVKPPAKPAPKDKPAAEAIRTRTRSPRSRRKSG